MWEMDITNKTMIVNDRWLEIVGYTSEEIKGVDIIEWKQDKNSSCTIFKKSQSC
jgi:hypothetical protein